MSAAVPSHPPLQMARLAEAENVDDVLRNVDQIVDWSINAESHLGYFAVVYKRITLAIRAAINDGQYHRCMMLGHWGTRDIRVRQRRADSASIRKAGTPQRGNADRRVCRGRRGGRGAAIAKDVAATWV
jgi:hypothetical protein